MKNKYSPIVLFVYNRIQHTTKTIEALRSNDLASESDLFIFSDAPKAASENEAVHTVREYVYKVDGFKSVTVIERPVNLGLANSIIDGVTSIVNKHGRVIVMEDDLVTSPLFIKYMNGALSFYESNKKVASIHGYVYPIEGLPETFFLRGADCWGWATWSDRWKVFEPDGKKLLASLTSQGLIKRFDLNGAYAFSTMLKGQIKGLNNSWAIRWHASTFLNSQYTLYPGKSLVENIGNDGSGTHCASTNIFSTTLSNTEIRSLPTAVKEDEFVLELIESYFRSQKLTANIFIKLFTLLKRKIKS